MSQKTKSDISKVSKNEPTLWDLIAQYFPPKYAKIYLNPINVKKVLEAALKMPAGSTSYKDRMRVHAAAFKLHEEDPEMRAAPMAEHPTIKKIVGRYYSPRRVTQWIREIVKHKPGRPPKSKS